MELILTEKVQLGSGFAVLPMPQAVQLGSISLAELDPTSVHGLHWQPCQQPQGDLADIGTGPGVQN